MQNPANSSSLTRYFWILLGLLLGSRVIAMFLIPLNDTTEARYGEIARKMLETKDWVTLWHTYTIPFWAKPPLSTWSSALSMKLFGVNELAVRLPALIYSGLILFLVWHLALKLRGRQMAMTAVLVLASSLFFYLDAGAVMTDPSLLFCTTYALIAYWNSLHYPNKSWGYQFFIALGLGMLAKGPIAVVLTGLPLFFWCCITHSWKATWQRLPWFSGIVLFTALALPWYLLAEKATPGFLNYFLIGEHWHRYLDPSWAGDKYGFAHYAPRGIIWLYTFLGFLPWSFVALGNWISNRKTIRQPSDTKQSGFVLYLGLWILIPTLFFTFSRNIIYTYSFTCLPALALLFAYYWSELEGLKTRLPILIVGLCALSLALSCALAIFPDKLAKTYKPIVAAWNKVRTSPKDKLIIWSRGGKFSAEFYAHGRVDYAKSTAKLLEFLQESPQRYLLVKGSQLHDFDAATLSKFNLITQKTMQKDIVYLYQAKS